MNYIKRLLSKDGLPLTFAIFYTVGLILFFSAMTRQLFMSIIPYTLLLVAWAVFCYHKEWNSKTILFLVSVFIVSVLVEIIGVASGKLFGVYSYGSSLGIKVADVPIIIGLNWVILVYGSNAVLSKITSIAIYKIVGASVLMVAYDLVLEKAAPILNMWEFKGECPPIRNYFMWLLLALIFQSILEFLKLNTNNRPARALFIMQFFFFIVIVISSLIFIK